MYDHPTTFSGGLEKSRPRRRPYDNGRRTQGSTLKAEGNAQRLLTPFQLSALSFRLDGLGPRRLIRAFCRTVLLFLLVLADTGCTYLRLKPPEPPPAPAVRNLTAVRENLEAADESSAHLLLTEIGRVNVPGFDGPIWRVAYRPLQAGLKQVLILAGLHGNETAGVDYVLALIQGLSTTTPPDLMCDIDILPLINPWGWVHDRPYAPSGIDIADDFTRFDSHEARIVRRFLREKRYDLVLDLREDPRVMGFYLRQYGMGSSRASAAAVDRVRGAGYPIENDPNRFLQRPADGIVDIPLWRLRVWPLSRHLTMGGYLRRNMSANVLTVITPAVRPLADRIAMQRLAVETLLAACAEPQGEAEAHSK